MTISRDDRLSGRMREARSWFERHHAQIEPDTGFASRVAARLTSDSTGMLGWAALRLLPASLLLVLVLGYLSVKVTGPTETAAAQSGDNDVIAWVLDGQEGAR